MKIPLVIIITLLHLFCLTSGDLILQDIEIPDLDNFTELKEKCDKLGGNGTYEKLKASKQANQNCVERVVDFKVLKNEVEEAKKIGSTKAVFKKYCARAPILARCVRRFTNAVRPCLNIEEKKSLNKTLNILGKSGEFACSNNGSIMSKFVEEEGVKCIRDHVDGIKNCLNTAFMVNTSVVDASLLRSLLLGKRKCDNLGEFQTCVVEELEKCKDHSPSNTVNEMIKFTRSSVCPNKTEDSILTSLAIDYLKNATEISNKIFKIAKDKCAQNAADGGFEAFKSALANATRCTITKFETNVIFTVPRYIFRENVQDCVEKLIETTRACLPEDEKYLPEFYLEQVLSAINSLYSSKDKFLSKYYGMKIGDCLQNFKEESAKNDVIKCFAINEITDLKKEAFCGRIPDAKICVTEQVKRKCIYSTTIDKLINDYFTAALVPCNKN